MNDLQHVECEQSGRLMRGLLSCEQMQAETGWHWRKLLRAEHEGLPVIKVGSTKLYPIDSCRAWLMSRVTDRRPRRPGRPRQAA
jgi:hypothetical protein